MLGSSYQNIKTKCAYHDIPSFISNSLGISIHRKSNNWMELSFTYWDTTHNMTIFSNLFVKVALYFQWLTQFILLTIVEENNCCCMWISFLEWILFQVRNFLESCLVDLRSMWMKRLAYNMCVLCPCQKSCQLHQVEDCQLEECQCFLDLDESLNNEVSNQLFIL